MLVDGILLITTKQTAQQSEGCRNHPTPPRTLLFVYQIVIIRHHTGRVLLMDGDIEQARLEVDRVHQVRIEGWEQRLVTHRRTVHIHTKLAGECTQRTTRTTGGAQLRTQFHLTLIVVGQTERIDTRQDEYSGKNLVIQVLVLEQH